MMPEGDHTAESAEDAEIGAGFHWPGEAGLALEKRREGGEKGRLISGTGEEVAAADV